MVLVLILALGKLGQPPQDRTGAEVFATVCAMCHVEDTPGMRAPSINALRRLTHENITDALTLGPMTDVGNGLSDKEIEAVATFLTAPTAKSAEPAASH